MCILWVYVIIDATLNILVQRETLDVRFSIMVRIMVNYGELCSHSKSYNPLPAKLILSYLTFHPLEVMSRYHDPLLQVGENIRISLILGTNICKYWYLSTNFIPADSDFC